MFREIRRRKDQLPDVEAHRLLLTEKRGILAVNGDDGYPYAFPVDYYYDREEGKIFVHGAKRGHKTDAIRKSDKVCFTVYGNDRYEEGDWAPFVDCVIVYGRCRLVDDPVYNEEKLRRLALRYFPTEEEAEAQIRKGIRGILLYEISIEHLCGKRVHEK